MLGEAPKSLIKSNQEPKKVPKHAKSRSNSLETDQGPFTKLKSTKRKGGPGDEISSPNCSKCEKRAAKKKKQEKTIITKETIHEFIERIVGKGFSKHVLTDMVFKQEQEDENSLIVVGRAQVAGSSKKQMRHVTPHAFIVEVIKSQVEKAYDPSGFLTSMIDLVLMLMPKEEGAAISSKDLSSSSYDMIREDIIKYSSKSMEVDTSAENKENADNKVYFISPTRVNKAYEKSRTPTKKNKAIEEYNIAYKDFCRIAFNKLIKSIKDDVNGGTIAAEAIARMILMLFNQQKNAAYPTEGNTMKGEIRYYEYEEDAAASNNEYEVLTAKELKQKFDDEEDINGKVRIVDNEGPQVTNSKEALGLLNDLIFEVKNSVLIKNEILASNIETYNAKYNKIIKLENKEPDSSVSDEIKQYYNDLTDKVSEYDLYYQAAKHLFIVFDYKALEDTVFVLSRRANQDFIEAYEGVKKSAKPQKFVFKDGKKYREDKTEDAGGYNGKAIFRNDEQDDLDKDGGKKLENLANKIAEHGIISLLPFGNLNTDQAIKSILGNFSNVVAQDHNVDAPQLCAKVEEKTKILLPKNLSGSGSAGTIHFKSAEESDKFQQILTQSLNSSGSESLNSSFEDSFTLDSPVVPPSGLPADWVM